MAAREAKVVGEIDVIIQSPLPVKLFRKGDTNSDFIKV